LDRYCRLVPSRRGPGIHRECLAIAERPRVLSAYLLGPHATARSDAPHLVTTGFNSSSNHPSGIRRRLRAIDLQDDIVVIRCANPSFDFAIREFPVTDMERCSLADALVSAIRSCSVCCSEGCEARVV
jgi:hypothetical protein